MVVSSPMTSLALDSLTDAVTDRLRQEIINGDFQFGTAVSEVKVARRYGVSRSPVREAFARLQHEGLVRTEARVGTFVFTMDREQFAQMSAVRAVLELAALREVMATRPGELIADWRALLAVMRESIEENNPKAYSTADGAFHDSLIKHAGNPYMTDAWRSFAAKMSAVRSRLSTTVVHMKRSFGEHEQLLTLIEDQSLRAALTLLERHIRQKGADFWPATVKAPRPLRERIEALRS